MSGKLNAWAYAKLLREDIAWLETVPRTLERDHVLAVLNDTLNRTGVNNKCEHGVIDGDWCEPCNREYKRARRESGDTD